MTDEQIFELVKEHFVEEEVDDDGYCWIEFAGKPDAFLKFARTIYQNGYDDGAFENSEPSWLG
jgi:hypothetical protein